MACGGWRRRGGDAGCKPRTELRSRRAGSAAARTCGAQPPPREERRRPCTAVCLRGRPQAGRRGRQAGAGRWRRGSDCRAGELLRAATGRWSCTQPQTRSLTGRTRAYQPPACARPSRRRRRDHGPPRRAQPRCPTSSRVVSWASASRRAPCSALLASRVLARPPSSSRARAHASARRRSIRASTGRSAGAAAGSGRGEGWRRARTWREKRTRWEIFFTQTRHVGGGNRHRVSRNGRWKSFWTTWTAWLASTYRNTALPDFQSVSSY